MKLREQEYRWEVWLVKVYGRRGRGQSSGEKDQRARPTEIERWMLRTQTEVKSKVIVWVRLCSNRIERMRWTKFERIRLRMTGATRIEIKGESRGQVC